jgi:hypothetical protein
MKRFLYLLSGVALTGLAVSCKPNIEEPTPSSSEELNLSKYVAVGDYYTAGFYNGGLNRESQQDAYPALLAQQFSRFNGNSVFEQPYFGNSGTPMLSASYSADGKLVLSNGEEFAKLLHSACDGMTNVYEHYNEKPTESLQNLGIPGLRIQQITTAGAGNVNTANKQVFNPYFERILPANTNLTYIQTIGRTKPTFFTLWIGMADIINYALTGGNCGTLPLASPNFRAAFIPALDTLTKRRTFTSLAEQGGIILDLPSIKDLPFTNTTKSLTIQQKLRTAANNESLTIYIRRRNTPSENANNLNYSVVAITDDDIILPGGLATLNTLTNAGGQTSLHGLSMDNPLTNDEVLDGAEINYIEQITESYNTIIANRLKDIRSTDKQLLYGNKVVVVSAKQLFGQLRTGIIYNGVKYSSQPVTGGVFSFDNFSLTPRGQALVANKIIQKMNTDPKEGGFGTNIPEVDVNSLPSLKLP